MVPRCRADAGCSAERERQRLRRSASCEPRARSEWGWGPRAVSRRDRHAESKKRKCPAREAQEAARTRQGLLSDQEQALSLGERVGRHRAQVRVRRPPPQEARLPPPVGGPDQRRRARERPDLRPADRRPQGGGQSDRSQEPRGSRGHRARRRSRGSPRWRPTPSRQPAKRAGRRRGAKAAASEARGVELEFEARCSSTEVRQTASLEARDP